VAFSVGLPVKINNLVPASHVRFLTIPCILNGTLLRRRQQQALWSWGTLVWF